MKTKNAKISNSVLITLIIVVGIIFVSYIGINSVNPTSNTVTGQGTATINVVPDLVAVYFAVQTNGDTSQEATDENSEIVDNLITELLKQGFSREDIETTGFNVYPDYSWNNGVQKLNGYSATHNVRVKLSASETGKIGNVIDAGVGAGAGISYINFELSQEKQNEYKAEALKLAAEDAKLKAEAIAEGLGKDLGKLVSTSSSDFDYYPWMLYESAGAMDASEAKAATTNIQPGEQEISARVTAVFKLK
ncbi:MAG: SIMPL domain-containing protein [Nanoarchaeota archaeon]|nr:SIMPL domain-containing protein [Nanoarchaeota archaeon]